MKQGTPVARRPDPRALESIKEVVRNSSRSRSPGSVVQFRCRAIHVEREGAPAPVPGVDLDPALVIPTNSVKRHAARPTTRQYVDPLVSVLELIQLQELVGAGPRLNLVPGVGFGDPTRQPPALLRIRPDGREFAPVVQIWVADPIGVELIQQVDQPALNRDEAVEVRLAFRGIVKISPEANRPRGMWRSGWFARWLDRSQPAPSPSRAPSRTWSS